MQLLLLLLLLSSPNVTSALPSLLGTGGGNSQGPAGVPDLSAVLSSLLSPPVGQGGGERASGGAAQPAAPPPAPAFALSPVSNVADEATLSSLGRYISLGK